MIASVNIMGETVPDRFVWAMIIIVIVLAIECRAWLLMDKKEKNDNKEDS